MKSVEEIAIDYGRVKEKILSLLNKDFLQSGYLNKRNVYWYSEYQKEWDKLDENRRFLDVMFTELWDIIEFMERKYDRVGD